MQPLSFAKVSALGRATAMSTFCSGMVTPASALSVLLDAFGKEGIREPLRCVSVCDCMDASRKFLLRSLPGTHVFGDMWGLVDVREWDDDWCYFDKWRAISSAPVMPSMYCYRCEAFCEVPASQVDCTGTPCQDFSRAGLMRGIEGHRIFVWLIYVRVHKHRQTPILLHENVPGFPEGLRQYA
jgi:hypothetical protein